MTDYTELKRLAEASLGEWYEFGELRCEDRSGYINGLHHDDEYFIAAANPAVVLALIAESDAARKELQNLRADNAQLIYALKQQEQSYLELRDERDQLSSEVAGLRTGYQAYERVNAELKAENEALRDDSEQNQYDANAWRNGEESVWIEVFNSEGDDPFISAVTGQITVEQLALIQAEILEYREDYFEKGSGLYVFKCTHRQAHYDNVGMTEPAHWETDFESYSPFPWEEEAAAMDNGEQS